MDDHPARAYRHPWLGVEVRHLATLSAVARTGSFRQAARELGYVQSAVSQQVARLERVVGACLVERQRGQRSIRLTRVGAVLAQRGDRILGELQAARIDLSAAAGAGGPDLRLVVANDMAPLLARLLAFVAGELPSVPIRVTEVMDDDELVAALDRGEADVALGVSLVAPGLATVTLLQDPFVIVAPVESPVARLTGVSRAADLAGERLIVPTAAVSHTHLHAPGLLLDRALQVPLAATVAPLVAQGHGIGLLPRSAADAAPAGGLAFVPTVGLLAPERVALGWHAARRGSVRLEAFCDAAVRGFGDDRLPRAA